MSPFFGHCVQYVPVCPIVHDPIALLLFWAVVRDVDCVCFPVNPGIPELMPHTFFQFPDSGNVFLERGRSNTPIGFRIQESLQNRGADLICHLQSG